MGVSREKVIGNGVQNWCDATVGSDGQAWEGNPTCYEFAFDSGTLPDFSIDNNELIKKLNSRFFVIVNSTSLVVEIIRQEQGVLEFNDYSPEGFRLRYCNKFVELDFAQGTQSTQGGFNPPQDL